MKVRVNSVYTYDPVLMDRMSGPTIPTGTLVRVRNLYGCPKANTMGQCYVFDAATDKFLGMVCCNSLQPLPKKGRA